GLFDAIAALLDEENDKYKLYRETLTDHVALVKEKLNALNDYAPREEDSANYIRNGLTIAWKAALTHLAQLGGKEDGAPGIMQIKKALDTYDKQLRLFKREPNAKPEDFKVDPSLIKNVSQFVAKVKQQTKRIKAALGKKSEYKKLYSEN